MSNSNANSRNFIDQIKTLGKTQQFYWFLGHLFTNVFFALNIGESFFSKSLKFYRFDFFSIIITYIIVIKQIHFKDATTIKSLNWKKLIRDENIQYFLMAIYFYMISYPLGRLMGSLYSYNIFSLFHVLNFFQNNLLHYLPISLQLQQTINNRINRFTVNYNQLALMVAANSEIFILFNVFMYLPIYLLKFYTKFFQLIVSILTLAVVVIFLKLRFNSNNFTNTIIKQYDYRISAFLHSQPQLVQLSQYYLSLKQTVIAFLKPLDMISQKKTQ